jgi:ureidoacrylate peracid hydrolase
LDVAGFDVVPERTALVNVDLQNYFVENAPDGLLILDRVNRLAGECRKAGVQVIHTSHVLRPDGSNIGVLGELVPPVKEEGFLNQGTRTAALHDDLVVEPGAFHGTDLELILRSRGIDTIVISGISTPVCCDTTAREANARDFRVLFLSDATATNAGDSEEAAKYQRATLDVIDGLFGQVLTMDELLQKLSEAKKAVGI